METVNAREFVEGMVDDRKDPIIQLFERTYGQLSGRFIIFLITTAILLHLVSAAWTK